MKYNILGTTGLKVPRIVFGAGAVGGVIFKPDRDTRLAAVQRALDHGINWFDTAPLYGRGQSEENLGWILTELGADPAISTKVMLSTDDLADIRGAVRRSVEASLTRLQRDRVALLQLHNSVAKERNPARGTIALADVFDDTGVLAGFEDVQREGLVDAFGFTGLGDTPYLHAMVTSGQFQAAQVRYNLLNPSAGHAMADGFTEQDYRQLIDVAKAHSVGVLCIRVLAAGVLAGRILPDDWHPIWPGAEAAVQHARRAALMEQLGLDDDEALYQTALRFILMTPGVTGTLIGFSTLEQIDQAVAVAEMPPLSDDVIAVLNKVYAKPPFVA